MTVGGNGNSTSFGGALIGSATLVKNGGGLFVLSGPNAYAATTINAGALEAATTASIPGLYTLSPTQISITPGAMVAVGAGGAQQWNAVEISYLLANSPLFASGGTLGIDTSGGNFTDSLSFTGSSLGLEKFGANTLTLSGTNSYGVGTAVSGGVLEAATDRRAAAHFTSGKMNVAAGATLMLAVGGSQGWTTANIASLMANAQFSPGANLGIDTSGGSFSLGTLGNSAIGLVLSGSNNLTLTASNSFIGVTTIGQGALVLANSAALLNSTVTVDVDNGLQFSPGVGTFYLGGLSGGNLLKLVDTSSGNVSLVTGGNEATTTFSGKITGGGSLTKVGAGWLVLSGSDGYSGLTDVYGGMLELANAGSWPTEQTSTSAVLQSSPPSIPRPTPRHSHPPSQGRMWPRSPCPNRRPCSCWRPELSRPARPPACEGGRVFAFLSDKILAKALRANYNPRKVETPRKNRANVVLGSSKAQCCSINMSHARPESLTSVSSGRCMPRLAAALLALAWALASGRPAAVAATYTWNAAATGADWNSASNWGGTVPGSGDIATLLGRVV